MSVTHVAGPVVGFDGGRRAIQRCPVCGEKLLDNLRVMAPVRPDGSPAEFLAWQEGRLIRFSGTIPQAQTDAGDFLTCENLPKDFCRTLVEE